MYWLFWPLLAYFLGSIPFGLIIGRLVGGVDVREHGSGNTGATNVARTCGFGWGVTALALDVLKGYAPVVMAGDFNPCAPFLTIVAMAALLGHVFSPFLGFKGGKGVATTVGVFLALSPIAALIGVVLTVAVIAASGYVSLGSLTLALAMPVLLLLSGSWSLVPLGLAVAVLLFWRHRENISRLYQGQENSWRKGR
jgi:glycerol-3-phosphate acyltransferase PlsY